ncbi:neutral alpha-glucosidase C isoform X2 [Hemicordylus capensis]|uniref:neutral alpha-glucosidase C isoform X2 n=1 Tax=Hemicordylus capensis TaxID=884348 RepID=UPI002304028C|nr:neutral alpha-glucosidase C isoform X2 [Hemicordylus capensis]
MGLSFSCFRRSPGRRHQGKSKGASPGAEGGQGSRQEGTTGRAQAATMEHSWQARRGAAAASTQGQAGRDVARPLGCCLPPSLSDAVEERRRRHNEAHRVGQRADMGRQPDVEDEAVDKSRFKTCKQIAFYRRQKRLCPGKSSYRALLDTMDLSNGNVKFQIINEECKIPLLVEIYKIEGNILRLKINEIMPLKPRYEVPDVLIKEPASLRQTISERDAGKLVLACASDDQQLHITANPFQIQVVSKDEIVLSMNSKDLLYFEHLQSPPQISKSTLQEKADGSADSSKENQEDLGLWEERFGNFLDIKASGPTSIGLDFSLHGFEHIYGIPQHAETLLLKNTSDNDVYRLYNLDVFGYRIHSKMGIYGSVPLLLAHKADRTIGVFWLNSSETLVEVATKAAMKVAPSGTPDISKQRVLPQTDVHWMSESGIIDTFILMGPSPFDTFKQYAQLTGTQALPPLFSLGYHQCRWNYDDEKDVENVDAGFDVHDIPYDVIWLDIEHTDGKRYFTWDKKRFCNPKRMQTQILMKKKRKLVVILDPHIKVDPQYTIYSEAKERGYFVKDREGKDFEGICWPGLSSYLDFTNPEVQEWYADQFAFKTYQGSSEILFAWNDMNEPSVFRAVEQTMQKDAVHHGQWEHREVHNLYGFYQQMATAEGLIKRSGGLERPFVLTRSFFAGSQRYGAVWTGDNKANWSYLKISIPMLLTISVAGISFCGADVGGFVGNPEPELLVRWYQAGALQPFFRGHADIRTRRREPWLFGEENTRIIREAIKERYCLLPYLYSLFYRAHTVAEPVMRPVWVEFPEVLETFGIEDEYMLGNALLVCPVTEPKATTVSVFLPGPCEIWYDFRNFRCLASQGVLKIPVTLNNIPALQRGGTLIPLKTSVGKSTEWMTDVSYELRAALDHKESATGELYLDDGHSFQYLNQKQFLLRKFTFHQNVFSSRCADENGQFHTKCVVERIVILGFKKQPSSVTVSIGDGKDKIVAFAYDAKSSVLTLQKLSLNIGIDWELQIK